MADLIAFPDKGQSPIQALLASEPVMVMVRGAVRLSSRPGLPHGICVEGRGKYFTDVDVRSLHQETVKAVGEDYRLAGKRVEV